MKLKLSIVFVLCMLSALLTGTDLSIAENGVAKAGILVPENTKPVVRLAAEELASYLKKITGAEFTIGTRSKFKTNFKLGFGDSSGLENEEFIIRTVGNDIEIFGRDSKEKFPIFDLYYFCKEKGTLRGVYYFLEQLGVRWPAPGMDHVPAQKTLVLKPLNIRFQPYFKDRRIGSGAFRFMNIYSDAHEYCKNNDEAMMWYLRIGESPRQFAHGCHSEASLALSKDPEWKSDVTRLQLMKTGKRDPRYSCWTHPDVKKIWMKAADAYFSGISVHKAGFKYATTWGRTGWKWPSPFTQPDEFMIDPMDHSQKNDGRCYCDRCQEYRKTHPCVDDTDMVWEVIGDVAEFIQKKHPEGYITTLIYPPKHQIPTRKIPSNVRVRLCLTGPKTCFDPIHFDEEFKTIREWNKLLGNKPVSWTYHCVDFNGVMPNIVETYPRFLKKYIHSLKGLSDGMYMETHAPVFSRIQLETYIYHRLMRNPDLDLDKELDEYCRILYGPAHREARQFHAELENLFADFWRKTVPAGSMLRGASPRAWKAKDSSMRNKLWTLTYTKENLDKLGKLIAAMEDKTAGTRYAKPVRLLRRYIYEVMRFQRNLRFEKNKIRKSLKLATATIAPNAVPTETDWKKAPVNRMVPMDCYNDKLKNNGSFQLISNGKMLFFRGVMDENRMKKTLTQSNRKNGDAKVSGDNNIEMFLTSMKDKLTWQLMINDRGVWTSTLRNRPKSASDYKYVQMPGCNVTVKREAKRWIVLASFPLKTLNPSGGEFRMNLIRTRKVAREPVEYSTFSPLSVRYHWTEPANYATVRFAKSKQINSH